MKTVIHLTDVHPSYDSRIFYKEARTLVEAGYKVTLIAQHDKDEVVLGVEFIALPKPRNRVDRIFRITWRLFFLALRKKGCIYHLHDPELIPLGIVLKVIGAKVIYDAHEEMTKEIASKEWIPRYLRKLVAAGTQLAETIASHVFDGIVAATPAIAESFKAGNIVLIQNYPIANELIRADSLPYQNRPKKIIYIGSIISTRGVREMIQAMEFINRGLGARLALVGEFSPSSLRKEMENLRGWAKVDFYGWQERDIVAQLLGEARAGLVLFYPTPNHLKSQPRKLFEYMSAGIPVIASDFPLWREIIEREKCGLLVDPQDPTAIAEAIEWILEHPEEAEVMGNRGKKAVHCKYNWNFEAAKLIRLYKELFKEE